MAAPPTMVHFTASPRPLGKQRNSNMTFLVSKGREIAESRKYSKTELKQIWKKGSCEGGRKKSIKRKAFRRKFVLMLSDTYW